MRNVLWTISKFGWSLCNSLFISIYEFVPPVIDLPVLVWRQWCTCETITGKFNNRKFFLTRESIFIVKRF